MKHNLGRVVEIDLTGGNITSSELTEETALSVIGGFGFNIDYLYRHLQPKTDPFHPENILLITLGLLTGTAAPSSSRIHINALSPLSGLIGSSSVGGHLGKKLRSQNIFSVIIRGTSDTPVFLDIAESGIKLMDASRVWGLDTRDSEAAIREIVSDQKAQLLSIGPAGENLVRYACIMAGIDHSAGHTGMGAVMGSKRLKAVCVRGGRCRMHANPETKAAVREYIESIRNSTSRFRDYSELGSSGDIRELNEMGLLSSKNYRSMHLAEAEKIDGRNLRSRVVKSVTCPGCAVSCKAEVEVKGGKLIWPPNLIFAS